MVGNSTIMNIILLLTGGIGFPRGDAYTNRILAFAKGFKQNQCNVTILIIYPGKKNETDESGIYEGINFKFMVGTIQPANQFKKKYIGLKGALATVNYLKFLHSEKPIDAIISFSQKMFQNYPVFLFTRTKNIVFLRENNEYPRIILKRGSEYLSGFEKLRFRIANRSFDGYILISEALKHFNTPLYPKNMPILIVPIIVEAERFKNNMKAPQKKITYCGNLYGEKDGVMILLEAFSMIHNKFSDYKLILIGDNRNKVEQLKLTEKADELGISKKIEFTGFVHGDKIPQYLNESAVLTLARPNNIQAQGGFPTKLGEYLATGRPVVVTDTSDISMYIKNGINGFLAEPGNVSDFAEKLNIVLSDYSKADIIGQRGKELTESIFSEDYQAARIIKYINKIKA